jgi:hypothetical protein
MTWIFAAASPRKSAYPRIGMSASFSEEKEAKRLLEFGPSAAKLVG